MEIQEGIGELEKQSLLRREEILRASREQLDNENKDNNEESAANTSAAKLLIP